MITAEMCDICGNSAVAWPQVFTVIGPKNMCGDCYWRYRRLVRRPSAFPKIRSLNMTHTIEEFLARVEQHTGKPARPTWDGWQVNCPAHDDRHASLSVCRGEAGHVLLKCHAGCKTDDVVAAIGWKLSDVTPEKRSLTYHKSPSRHAMGEEHSEPEPPAEQGPDARHGATCGR